MSLVYHITTRNAALKARQSGVYHPASLMREGFIHFSQPHQVLNVANAFYRGQRGLVLLEIETERLKAELRYEPPVHPANSSTNTPPSISSVFPHLYGPLNMDAVVDMVDFPCGADGLFTLPPSLS